MVFIRYFEGAMAYQMLDPGTGRVHVSRDTIFDENRGWEWDSAASYGDSTVQREFTVRYYTAQVLTNDIDEGVPEEDAPPPSPG
jgi:hypothetical protein